MEDNSIPRQVIKADPATKTDHEVFAAFVLAIAELKDGAFKRSELRGPQGRRFALIATKLEEAYLHADYGFRAEDLHG